MSWTQNIPKEAWSGVFTLAGTVLGAVIGFASSFLQNRVQRKREQKNELLSIYRMAIDSICHYLDVVQEDIAKNPNYNEQLEWKARERGARVHHYKSIAYLRMLGEDEIAMETISFFEFIAQQDSKLLRDGWADMLQNRAYPLIDKIERKVKQV